MKVNQVYQIVNAVSSQIQGTNAVAVVDASTLISLGDTVLNSGDPAFQDAFLTTLVDKIGKTIISNRVYSPKINSLLMESFEFGAILQKIYVAPISASQSEQWDLTDGGTVDQYIISKPTAKQKLFDGIDTWEVDVTIPEIQLKSAFESAEKMAAFIDAIFVAMKNSMEIQLQAMAEVCYANFIALTYKRGTTFNGTAQTINSKRVVDLVADYNALNGTKLTAQQCRVSSDFYKYASMRMALAVEYVANMSTAYNSDGYSRFTSKENARFTVISNFAKSCDYYLSADTYHDELVALPEYTEIPFWQGMGVSTSDEFADVTGIIINPSDNSGDTVNLSGVVGLISDVDAMGITIDNRRSRSAYNAKGEYTNYFEKADMGYFNDMSENGIVFLVTDTLPQIVAP